MLYHVKVGVVTRPSGDEKEQQVNAAAVFTDVSRVINKMGLTYEVTVSDSKNQSDFPVFFEYNIDADSEQKAVDPCFDFCLFWKNTRGAQPVIDVTEATQPKKLVEPSVQDKDFEKEQERILSEVSAGDESTDEMTALRETLTQRGVKFHHKAGIEKLKALVSETR